MNTKRVYIKGQVFDDIMTRKTSFITVCPTQLDLKSWNGCKTGDIVNAVAQDNSTVKIKLDEFSMGLFKHVWQVSRVA